MVHRLSGVVELLPARFYGAVVFFVEGEKKIERNEHI
jgi:hypothetical protein